MSDWSWDDSKIVGDGGFGKVYEATGPGDQTLVAKVVPKVDGASRELLVARDLPRSRHIVPVLNVEETEGAWVLFMPRADYSLRAVLDEPATPRDAIAILLEIAEALAVIEQTVVHRDLKPDNILLLDGTWALCDFGIARYVDSATAADTRKHALSPAYAAPEQWRYEHATAATDVYAFGVLAFELLAGHRPFDGSWEDLRELHLNTIPPQLPGNRKVGWIVSECVQKAPQARPTASNLVLRLSRVGEEASSRGASALALAQTGILAARAAEQTQAEASRAEADRRDELFRSAALGYEALVEELVEFVCDQAPATTVNRSNGVTLSLGSARLILSPPLKAGQLGSPFDVIAHGGVRLEAQGRSRSHSLYYADFQSPKLYGWFELGFMGTFSGADFDNEPRALPPREGLPALDRTIGRLQLGYGIRPIDPSELDEFVDLWAERFGRAASGSFPTLSQLPDGAVAYPPRRA